MTDKIEIIRPMDIERRSMEIIDSHLKGMSIPAEQLSVVRRVIHTTADFDYVQNLTFTNHAVEAGLAALLDGADIVTDTNMALAGIHKASLHALGGQAHCFMADADVTAEAKRRGVTRATVSMEKACTLQKDLIFAVGNAPTALVALDELIRQEKARPRLIIGVPVGFVNVVEAKEIILQSDVPCIVARGNKGGSNVAAAICNALLYQIKRVL